MRHTRKMQAKTLCVSKEFADFDSAIRRFESWRPSQPVRSLRRRFRLCEDRRHFRGLAGNGRVFGEENRALPTEEGVFLDESLLHAPQPCSFFVIVAARLQQSRESYAICSDMRRFGPR